jgi:nitrogen-specific signal transduction histidine kinase
VPIQYRGAPHVLYIGRDIGERKRAESRLRQAERMEAIGHLSGGVAHDFNNLLAAIMGYVVLAAERNMDESGASQDPKLAGHLDKALASCRQARDLIQQMLTFSRGQRGSPRPLALADAAAESLKLLRSSLPASLQIETLFEESPVTLLDPVQLDQILLNLSINARDAMAGVGRIAVRVRPTVLRAKAVCASCRKRFRGEFVELSVTDSGPGIAPPVLERMFEPFFTTKEVGRGSGMGLATVHGIVHEHQGHVLVESAPGAGSSFRILLPMAADGTVAAPRDAAPRRNVRKPLNGRVLVVDDERAVADFMRELLESWGLQAAAATNPRGVLERIVREPLDLVILDQTMPGMTGISLAREIAMARPQLPVVLYTGNSDRLDKAELAAAGVRALLNKPVEPDALYDILRTHLG